MEQKQYEKLRDALVSIFDQRVGGGDRDAQRLAIEAATALVQLEDHQKRDRLRIVYPKPDANAA